MAKGSTGQRVDREALIAELARSRAGLARQADRLGGKINVPERIQTNFQDHLIMWLGGSLAAGFLISKFLPITIRTKGGSKEKGKSGALQNLAASTIFGLLGIAGKQILRHYMPDLKNLALKQLDSWWGRLPDPLSSDDDIPDNRWG